jgi:hypothetical protein
MKTLLVIDPGASGGFVIQYSDGTVDAKAMPETPKDVCDLITVVHDQAMADHSEIRAYMEEVRGFIGGDGDSDAHPSSRMFNFGQGYGVIKGCLYTLGIPFEVIQPGKWQKGLSLGSRGINRGNYAGMTPAQRREEKKRISIINGAVKRDWKRKLKERAQQLFPQLRVTLKTSDALLMFEWARRQENNPPPTQPQMSLGEPPDADEVRAFMANRDL